MADVDAYILPPYLKAYDSVTKLYTAIKDAFTTMDPAEIFTGQPARQVDDTHFSYRVKMMPVTNRKTASDAIDLILEQGGGIEETPQSSEPAHFERFLKVLRELEQAKGANTDFDPALPVASNPQIA